MCQEYTRIYLAFRFSPKTLSVIRMIAMTASAWLSFQFVRAVPPVDYKISQNFEDQWLVYDNSYKGYVPYFERLHGRQAALSLYINLKQNDRYGLLLQASESTHLFIQSQLCRTLPARSRVLLGLDSLRQHYKRNAILLTVYVPTGHAFPPAAHIAYAETVKPSGARAILTTRTRLASLRVPRPREISQFQDFVTVTVLVLFAFYTFLLNYHPKAFRRNFSFQTVFTVDTRDEASVIAKPLSQINILFLLAHCMLLSLFYIIAQRYSTTFFANVLPVSLSDSFSGLGMYFVFCTGVVFALLIGKYAFVYAVGVVFGVNKTASVHYYEYLLFSRVFFLVVVPLQFILMLSYPHLVGGLLQIVLAAIIILHVIRITVIGSVLNKLIAFRNLYLFSYLCATELIPLLIGIKFLAK